MTTLRKPLATYLSVLFLAALALALVGARGSARHAPFAEPTAPDARAVPDLAGGWTGYWEDTDFFVGGDVDLVIAVDGDHWTATGTIDFTEVSPAVGVVDLTADGTLVGNVLNFTYDAEVGSGSATLTDAACAGTGTVGDPLFFGDFVMGGTAASNEISGTFDFDTGGQGNMVLTRAVADETVSWSDLKSDWR